MTTLVARIKILPVDVDVNLESLLGKVRSNIPNGMSLKSHGIEPIAFGLNAVIADFTLNDSEGQMDLLEDSIKRSDGVGQLEVMSVSRQSVNID
ncbi:MAG TPA: elongation factor 1-beta [Nitrososphaeraceae archaeon]|jgi:elongation factor 1-beta